MTRWERTIRSLTAYNAARAFTLIAAFICGKFEGMQLFLAGAVIFSALLSSARYVCTELKFVLKETSLGHALQSQRRRPTK